MQYLKEHWTEAACYIVKKEDNNTPRSIIAKKDGVLKKVIAEKGDIVRDMDDYVKKGDLIVDGQLIFNEKVTGKVRAQGHAYAEVWYITKTEYPYAYYEEKLTIKQNGDKLQLCVNNYIQNTEPKKVAEDDNVKIRIENKLQYYGYEIYSVRITNKTNKDIVMYDSLVGDEIFLETGSENRMPSKINATMVLEPNETRTFEITFQKYFDEQTEDNYINFNKIRIMNNYTGEEQSEEEEINKSDKIYSIGVPLQ